MKSLDPARLLPGRGPIIGNPAAAIDGYIRHRSEREMQVVEALEAGASTPEAIVAVVYPALDRALEPAARDTVLAHLIKLQEDGRVLRNEGWTLK